MKVEADEVEWAFLLCEGAGTTEFLKRRDVLTNMLYDSNSRLPPPEHNPPPLSQENVPRLLSPYTFTGARGGVAPYAATSEWAQRHSSKMGVSDSP